MLASPRPALPRGAPGPRPGPRPGPWDVAAPGLRCPLSVALPDVLSMQGDLNPPVDKSAVVVPARPCLEIPKHALIALHQHLHRKKRGSSVDPRPRFSTWTTLGVRTYDDGGPSDKPSHPCDSPSTPLCNVMNYRCKASAWRCTASDVAWLGVKQLCVPLPLILYRAQCPSPLLSEAMAGPEPASLSAGAGDRE